MGIFKRFRTKKRPKQEIDEEVREAQREARKTRSEILTAKRELDLMKLEYQKAKVEQQIDELQGDIEGEAEDFNIEGMLNKIIMAKLMSGGMDLSALGLGNDQPATEVTPPSVSSPTQNDFSRVDELIASIPKKTLKKAKKLEKDDLISLIKMRFPDLNDQEIEYGLEKIK